MRLIDADVLIEEMKKTETEYENEMTCPSWWSAFNVISEQPTAYDIGKVVKELEERTDFLKNCTKYGNKNAKQQDKSYSAMMMYEVADLVDDLIEIVKQGMEDIPDESGVLPKDVYSAGYNKAIEDYHRLIADEIKNDPVNPYLLHLYNFNNHIKKCLTKR